MMRQSLTGWMLPLLQVYFHPADALSHASPDLSASLTASLPGQPPLDPGERQMERTCRKLHRPVIRMEGTPVKLRRPVSRIWRGTLLPAYHNSLPPSFLHGPVPPPTSPAGAACAAAYQLPSHSGQGKPIEEWSVADVQVRNSGLRGKSFRRCQSGASRVALITASPQVHSLLTGML